MENNTPSNNDFELDMTTAELAEAIRAGVARLMENSSDSLSNEYGENAKPETIEETTDSERYEEVVFMQGQEADETMDILNNEGKDAAMEHLKQWHDPGNHMGRDEIGLGSMDKTYKKDGYIMYWNPYLPYIGLTYDTEYNMNEDSQLLRHRIDQRGKIGDMPLGQHSPHSPNVEK